MLEGLISNKLAHKMFDEEELYKIVKRHAFWGALVMLLPLFGLDWIVFVAILWRMYNKLCLELGTTLKFSTIAVGFVVNIGQRYEKRANKQVLFSASAIIFMPYCKSTKKE